MTERMALWEFQQQLRLRGVERAQRIGDSPSQVRHGRSDRRSDDLEDGYERLALLTEAMWRVLCDRVGVTEAELLESLTTLVEERAPADKDARPGRPPVRCAGCGAACPRELDHCQYCGAAMPYESAFDAL